MKLAGKVALVIGSTSGIGRAIAKRFAADGARVVVSGRKEERGQAVVREIQGAGGEAVFVRMDAGVEDDVNAGIGSVVKTYGRLDSLVFAAASYDAMFGKGDMRDRAVHELGTPALEAIFRVGVFGAFWACKYAIPEMLRAGGGTILVTSSLNAIEGKLGTPAYSASKGALDALTRQLAIEYGKKNIRTNSLNIGFVLGENIGAMGAQNPQLINAYLEAIPYVRGGTPEDIAAVASFLASDDAAYVNGVCMPVDGGRRVKTAAPNYTGMINVTE